ncbi:hypothetical protein BH20ACT21_BH20ACT21_02120 [soil metagenome]
MLSIIFGVLATATTWQGDQTGAGTVEPGLAGFAALLPIALLVVQGVLSQPNL